MFWIRHRAYPVNRNLPSHDHDGAVLSQTRFLLAYTSGPAMTGCCGINGLAPLPERQNGAENAYTSSLGQYRGSWINMDFPAQDPTSSQRGLMINIAIIAGMFALAAPVTAQETPPSTWRDPETRCVSHGGRDPEPALPP